MINIKLHKELFKIHSNGQIGSWSITVADKGDGTATMLRSACKVLGGKAVETPTNYTDGKNIGRSNETSPLEQALLDAESRYKKQLDKGYVVEMPKAGDVVTNSLGFIKPMLAQPIEKVKSWEFPVYVSPKLDGHRMLATVQDGQVVLYSRQGKEVSVEHIRGQLQILFDNKRWDGTTLDGEIYQHGETLQRISSLVKKPKPESNNLVYHVYDITDKNESYGSRLATLNNLLTNFSKSIVVVPTSFVGALALLNEMHSEHLAQGYEGTMIRHGDTGYEDGKRSKSLMKKKDFQDAEFKVVNVLEGKPIIKANKTYNVAIYECVTNEGRRFTCTAPGTMQEKHDAWVNRAAALEKMLTVKFFNFTPDNIPFLPVALRLREDI